LSISSHLTLSPNSADMKPVALPPGRAAEIQSDSASQQIGTGRHGHQRFEEGDGDLRERGRTGDRRR
jgi:hypothetical protein